MQSSVNLTPERLMAQWTGATHKLQVNLHNFEVKAGKAAVAIFKQSFAMKRFNSHNARPWASWQGNYKGKGELMQEHGILKNSIKVKSIQNHAVTVFTDPNSFNNPLQRHPGFCYAAVHNNLRYLDTPPPRGPKRERQFIGHSTLLLDELHQLSLHIFDGFPK